MSVHQSLLLAAITTAVWTAVIGGWLAVTLALWLRDLWRVISSHAALSAIVLRLWIRERMERRAA